MNYQNSFYFIFQLAYVYSPFIHPLNRSCFVSYFDICKMRFSLAFTFLLTSSAIAAPPRQPEQQTKNKLLEGCYQFCRHNLIRGVTSPEPGVLLYDLVSCRAWCEKTYGGIEKNK